jgi:hypothetical protein
LERGRDPYSVGFEIIRSERNLPASGGEANLVPQASAPATAETPQKKKEEATAAVASVSALEVAEVARQARIAKAVKEAKEKAERDNPPPH